MTVRSIIRDHVVADSALTVLIAETNWWSSGSLMDENAPPRPFVVIRYGVTAPGVGALHRGSVTFWVHDDLGDYSRINSVLRALYSRLNKQVALMDGEGNEVTQIDWSAESSDLFDPGYRTITRTTTFNFVGKGV